MSRLSIDVSCLRRKDETGLIFVASAARQEARCGAASQPAEVTPVPRSLCAWAARRPIFSFPKRIVRHYRDGLRWAASTAPSFGKERAMQRKPPSGPAAGSSGRLLEAALRELMFTISVALGCMVAAPVLAGLGLFILADAAGFAGATLLRISTLAAVALIVWTMIASIRAARDGPDRD
jgi:hypothetical protein